MKIAKIRSGYVEKKLAYETKANYLEIRIAKREAQLSRLKKRLHNNYMASPSWIDEIIKPIAEEMIKHFPDRQYDILGPFGLTCETAIHFYLNGSDNIESCLSITFRPGDLDKGEIKIVDYSKNTMRYRENTLGEINGMNYPSVPIPKDADIQWLVDRIN